MLARFRVSQSVTPTFCASSITAAHAVYVWSVVSLVSRLRHSRSLQVHTLNARTPMTSAFGRTFTSLRASLVVDVVHAAVNAMARGGRTTRRSLGRVGRSQFAPDF